MKKIIILLIVIFMLVPSVSFAQERLMTNSCDNLKVIGTVILEDNGKSFIKQDKLEDGSIVESGIIFLPNVTTFDYIGGSWDSGTCYANVRGVYVYKIIDGNRIQFTADVALVDPKCGDGSKIMRGYDITLNRRKGGYFTTTTPTQYTASHSGYSVSLFVENGKMWTD